MRTEAHDFRLRFGCNTCVKVFALNWDRTHGIYVQICRTRCYDLREIFEEHTCVIVFTGGTHRAGILMNVGVPKHYITSRFIISESPSWRFDFNRMLKILKTLLTFRSKQINFYYPPSSIL